MRYFFSKTRTGFYTDEWHPNRPDDCVEISEDDHRGLLQEQHEGKELIAGEDGRPIAVERVHDAQVSRCHIAKLALNESDYVVHKAYESGEPVPFEWREYREQLREVIRGNRSDIPTKP